MIWLYLALLAYFLNALASVVDKYLLAGEIPHTNAYAFYVAILSSFALLLGPFGVHVPPLFNLITALVSGASFFVALIFLYKAIQGIDITEVNPAIGALTALATFGFGFFLLPSAVTGLQLFAFSLLVSGTLLMSYFHLTTKAVWYIIISAIGFGFSYVTLKLFFDSTNFVSGLFWTRLGLVLAALAMLMLPSKRKEIKATFHKSSGGSKFLFMANKLLGTVGYVLIYYAIKVGNVVFVNALQGIQYVFILIMGAILAQVMPKLFERHARKMTPRKIVATLAIIIGLLLLFT